MAKSTITSNKISRTIISKRGFVNNRHKALMGLVLLGLQLDHKRQETLKPFGITSAQYNVLRILRGQAPKRLAMDDIRKRMLDKNSDVTRLVDRLLKTEYVTRELNEFDRRIVNIGLTQKGLDLLAQIDKIVHHVWAFEGVSDEEIDALIGIVEKMLD
jgi:MarR family transcriptional regulator, multiple gene regulator MgrA